MVQTGARRVRDPEAPTDRAPISGIDTLAICALALNMFMGIVLLAGGTLSSELAVLDVGWMIAYGVVIYGTIQPLVDRTFTFEQAPQAHAYISERRNVGKVVLVPDATPRD